ncbi:hypothetical protein OIU34_16660 [Pararhizobium sp. BT-229]|uniref:hypothetical protein n=1 Tax=Pararhizobium sp. BT-229 TaxID=2986923 RepID=UPI0021F73772|nr:hypothetical protein [Pararhizobium sp. BT-229]MCV9963536.1 hypothetical protein [Pararhizobium sp. BT-229]
MPKIKMPKPWKAGSRKGTYFRPTPYGLLVYEPAEEEFRLEVKRGTSAGICDRWGPWRGVLDDEEAILGEAAKWYQELEKAGWTTMPYRDPQGEAGTHEANRPHMVAALAKLPRCELIPSILLDMLDSDRASKGKAVAGGVLRVASHDFHLEQFGNFWAGAPADRVWLTIQNPGQSKRTVGGKRLSLDIHQIDALLDFLVGARAGMAPKETTDAVQKQIRHGLPDEAPADRIARMRHHSLIMDAILAELSDSTPEQLETVLAMTQMINAGDMTVDVIYGPEGEPDGQVH